MRDARLPLVGRLAIALALIVASAVAGLFGPAGAIAQDNAAPQPTVRVVHASAGAPEVDIIVDGQVFIEALTFGSVTDYAPLPEGEHTVQVVPTGGTAEQAVIDETVELEAGNAYILAAVNPLNEIALETYEVNLDAVEPGNARVRVIHQSPGAGEVDVAVSGGDELFGGVGEGDASDYSDVPAGTYSLDVLSEDQVIYTAEGLELADGHVYDIFAIGQVADDSFALLPLDTPVSQPCAEILGLTGTSSDGCLRVVHASPDAPAVDVYVNGTMAVENLAFGTATEFLPVPAGDNAQVQVTATGGSPDESVIDQELELTAGQAYQVAATGLLDEIEATVNEVDLTPLPEGQARVRVVHASPDAGNVDIGVADGDNLFEDVGFQEASEYAIVDAGDYELQVRAAGEDTIVLAATATLEPGTTYDIFAVGQAEDGSLQLLVLSAQSSVREGELATPEAAGTPEPAATVVSEAGTPADGEGAAETAESGVPTETPAG